MNGAAGHNLPLDAIASRATEAMRDYEAGLAKEQTGRDDAISAIVRYGVALAEGRALHTSNNAFGAWIKASSLDRVKPFDLRQERVAAGQIAKNSVDSTGCSTPFPAAALTPDPRHDVVARQENAPPPVAARSQAAGR